MTRGIDYYSLLHEKEQLLARIKEIDQKVKLRTDNLFQKHDSQNQRLDGIQFNKNNEKPDEEEFAVLITDENSSPEHYERHFVNPTEYKPNQSFLKPGSKGKQVIEDIPLKAGKPVKSIGELQFKDKTYQLEFIKTPLFINGYTSKVLTLIKEISAIHNPVESSELFKQVFETTDDFIVIKDLDLKIISANNAFIKAIGKKDASEIMGLSDFEIFGDIPENYKNQREDQIAQKLKEGESIESEGKFVLVDGSFMDTLVKRFPIYEDDNLIATASIFRDITSLKNEHRKLIRSEEKYRMIIENQGEGACIIDNADRFIFANSAAEKLFDTKRHGLIDRSIKDFVREKDFNQIKSEIGNTKGQNITRSFELELINLNTKKYVLLSASPLYVDGDYLAGAFLLFRDITERRKIEEELLRSELSLKETIATKDKFFSIIAHDLKNPFGSIMGFAELILRKLKPENIEKIEHYAKIIHTASKHGFDLLENLLAWSRSQNGSLKYSPSKVRLNEIIDQNVELLSGSAEKKQISIMRHLEGEIDVYIDEDMVNTVLRNLLSNAIKYSNENSLITIKTNTVDNSYVKVSIADEGVGMTKTTLEQLFRIDTNKSAQGTNGEEGTGLGLILCKEFIEKNNGEIWAESALYKGSTFYFTLPLAIQDI